MRNSFVSITYYYMCVSITLKTDKISEIPPFLGTLMLAYVKQPEHTHTTRETADTTREAEKSKNNINFVLAIPICFHRLHLSKNIWCIRREMCGFCFEVRLVIRLSTNDVKINAYAFTSICRPSILFHVAFH